MVRAPAGMGVGAGAGSEMVCMSDACAGGWKERN